MVGGYIEDLAKPQNCQNGAGHLNRNGCLLIAVQYLGYGMQYLLAGLSYRHSPISSENVS